MHRICVVWRVRRSWFLCQDLYDSTEQPLYNPRSSVILGHPLLDSISTPSVHPCSALRHEKSHTWRDTEHGEHGERGPDVSNVSWAVHASIEISQDISGFLTISIFLTNGGTAWQCFWCGLVWGCLGELDIWVCLKIGYIPNYSHLIGIMISKTIGFRGTLFSDTPV